MKAELYVRGRRIIAVESTSEPAKVTHLPVAPPRQREPDPVEAARGLIDRYQALPNRERNYMSKLYADLFCDALDSLLAVCTPLREETARQVTDILRRARYGDGPAAALRARECPQLRLVRSSEGESCLGQSPRSPRLSLWARGCAGPPGQSAPPSGSAAGWNTCG